MCENTIKIYNYTKYIIIALTNYYVIKCRKIKYNVLAKILKKYYKVW